VLPCGTSSRAFFIGRRGPPVGGTVALAPAAIDVPFADAATHQRTGEQQDPRDGHQHPDLDDASTKVHDAPAFACAICY
jgi:hypothetical protein